MKTENLKRNDSLSLNLPPLKKLNTNAESIPNSDRDEILR